MNANHSLIHAFFFFFSNKEVSPSLQMRLIPRVKKRPRIPLTQSTTWESPARPGASRVLGPRKARAAGTTMPRHVFLPQVVYPNTQSTPDAVRTQDTQLSKIQIWLKVCINIDSQSINMHPY